MTYSIRFFFCLPALVCALAALAQTDVKNSLEGRYRGLPKATADSLVSEDLNQIFNVPDLLNDLFARNLEALKQKDARQYQFIRDLNIRFKSFQTDTLPVSLGFEYKYENNWVKNRQKAQALFIQTYSLSFNGNVAFKKINNPNNFLESSFSYDGSFLFGGKAAPIDDATSDLIQQIEDTILERRSRREPYLHLYRQVNNLITVSDQFYLGLKGKLGFESTQDFSKKQWAPGLLLGLGAKGWNRQEALRYLNVLDYPFAVIRYLTRTDQDFTIYGSTFPSFLFGLDYVMPTQDDERQELLGSLDPFTRLRFEAGFKTRVAQVGNEAIHFSANYRWYKELNAGAAIREADLQRFSFFVAAIESSSGLFVSYTTGKLPFDRRNDQIYAIGFKYDLGNLNK